LLFAVAALGQECESGTCVVCKTNSSCDWYGFDCLSKTSSAVVSLNIPPKATCDLCQAGSCADCQNQANCSWYSNVIPGVPGKCDVANTTSSTYKVVNVCPTCQNFATCDLCSAQENVTGCGWYVLPGNLNGKCREAPPAFAYSKVNQGSCSTGNLCAGVNNCQGCQLVTNSSNATVCSWYTSKSASFYNSKCDDYGPGVVSADLYTQEMGSCPLCAGTSCLSCKAELNCKWVAATIGFGTGFGQCLQTSATTPALKKEIPTCPATCQVYSCQACSLNSQCSWFSGSTVIDDSCDLATDGKLQHPTQTATSPCLQCMADRCYECNGLAGCGWYAKKVAGFIVLEGCYATAPAGRVLVPNSDSKCKGVPSGSSQVAASIGVLAVLFFLS